MGCEGCRTEPKAVDMRLEIAKNEAKTEAIKTFTTMAVYEDAGDFRHIDAAIAYRDGYIIRALVSKYQ